MNRLIIPPRHLEKALALLFLIAHVHYAHADVVVIVHKDAPLVELSKDDVRSLFMGKLFFYPGSKVEAVTFDQAKQNAIREVFYLHVAKKSQRKMNSYWARYLFTGKGQPPKALDDGQHVLETVSQHIGHIGYIEESAIDDRVKVVYRLGAAVK